MIEAAAPSASRALRIAIDARSVFERKSGIGNTLEALIRHMVPISSGMEFLLLRHPDTRDPIIEHPRVRELRCRGETKSVHTVFSLGRALRGEPLDLYHSPADLVPLGIDCPWVVTIHDLMWVEAPWLASAFLPKRIVNGIWYRTNIRRAVRGARSVVAISHATRDAIERIYGEQAAKVRVIHHGIDLSRYGSAPGDRALLDPFLPRDTRYSLVVGQGSPYKNHRAMVRAFVDAIGPDSDHKLVLVRRFSRVDRGMRRLLARPEVARAVIALPHVTDEVLFALYRHARMLLFASLYEGFGLPALEAMAFGLPVLASTAPAVLEVTDRAALHADPRSHDDLVEKMRMLDGDEALRANLISAGHDRVREFPWETAARAMLEVYRDAAR